MSRKPRLRLIPAHGTQMSSLPSKSFTKSAKPLLRLSSFETSTLDVSQSHVIVMGVEGELTGNVQS